MENIIMPNAIPPIHRSPISDLPAMQNSNPLRRDTTAVSSLESMGPSSSIWDCLCNIFSWPKRMIEKLFRALFRKEGNTINWEQKVRCSGIAPQFENNVIHALKKMPIDACAFDHIFVCLNRQSQSDIFFEPDGVFNDLVGVCNSPGKALIIHSITDNYNRGPYWGAAIEGQQPTMERYFQNRNKMVMLSSNELMEMTQAVLDGPKVPDFLTEIISTGIIPHQSRVPAQQQGLFFPHPEDRDLLNRGS